MRNRIRGEATRERKGGGGLSEGGELEYLGVRLLSGPCVYYFLLVLLAVLGTFVNSAFYAFHTLHIATQNQLLQRVIKAVTLNGRSLLWVCFLGAVCFYVYALLGFLFLRSVFLGNDLYCRTLLECFISTIRHGLMFGMADVRSLTLLSPFPFFHISYCQNFDIPEDDPNNTFSYYTWKTIFDISFFAIIITIGRIASRLALTGI